MAFLRFSRDKRGVENFYLVQPTTNRRGKVRPRVLYWFRSPPDVKVGRQPFDADVRRALEAQHPDVAFDWRAIVETPIPSADADKWRERRRAERAAKQAAAAEELAEAADDDAETAAAPEAATPSITAPADEVSDVPTQASPSAAAGANANANAGNVNANAGNANANRSRRRRRRGGGGGRGGNPSSSDRLTPSAGSPAGPLPAVTGPSGD